MTKVSKKRINRYTALTLIMCLIFGTLTSRLAYLQVVKATEYTEKANNKSVMELVDPAPRGEILDKNGTVLATNKLTYSVTYSEIKADKERFFEIITEVFRILDEKGEMPKDDFPIIKDPSDENNVIFEFKEDSESSKRRAELRFKKDRGFDEDIEKKLFGSKQEELTEEQQKEVDEALLKITAAETFNELIEDYKIDNLNNPKYSFHQQRRFMIIKDSIKMQSFTKYEPVAVASNIKKETAMIILQKMNDLSGIDVSMEPVRTYPFEDLGSAFLGYISKIPSWKKEEFEQQGYDASKDYIGTAGIEQAYEDRLKGSKGNEIVKVDKYGSVTEKLGEREIYPGQTIQLTIDKDVQSAAEKALDETMKKLQSMGRVGDVNMKNATRGAAVAIDVNTGAVIALASRPGFNPNYFVEPGGLTTEQYKQYFNLDLAKEAKERGYTEEQIEKLFPIDKSIAGNTSIRQDFYDILPKPLYNYATQAAIPPGSTFKPLTAVAGLETGVISANTTIVDNGTFDDGMNFTRSFDVGGYGRVDVTKALEVSSNPFFMFVGKLLREKFGENIIAEFAQRFGLGLKSPSGIEIPERYGQVYSAEAMQETFATQYLWITMQTLKAGKDSRGNVFPPIDIYERETDTEALKTIKTNFKKQIQQSIKTGEAATENYNKLLKELIAADTQYDASSFTKEVLSSIVKAINGITVNDANSQLKIGANMYNASIGQGISSFTPIQMANYMATLVNGGNRYKLHLVDKILSPEGEVIEQKEPEVLEKVDLKEETIRVVKEGMHKVNNDTEGTASSVFKDFAIDSGGKTGSATFSNQQESIGRTSYGWYVGFAPFDKPQIAVAIVIFDGGHGAYVAPVAKSIYEAYFKTGGSTP